MSTPSHCFNDQVVCSQQHHEELVFFLSSNFFEIKFSSVMGGAWRKSWIKIPLSFIASFLRENLSTFPFFLCRFFYLFFLFWLFHFFFSTFDCFRFDSFCSFFLFCFCFVFGIFPSLRARSFPLLQQLYNINGCVTWLTSLNHPSNIHHITVSRETTAESINDCFQPTSPRFDSISRAIQLPIYLISLIQMG